MDGTGSGGATLGTRASFLPYWFPPPLTAPPALFLSVQQEQRSSNCLISPAAFLPFNTPASQGDFPGSVCVCAHWRWVKVPMLPTPWRGADDALGWVLLPVASQTQPGFASFCIFQPSASCLCQLRRVSATFLPATGYFGKTSWIRKCRAPNGVLQSKTQLK